MGIKHPTLGTNDLRTLNPQVASEWLLEKNVGLSIDDYVAGSAKVVWWKCATCSCEWKASVRSRYQKGSGCPICACKERGKHRVQSVIRAHGCFCDLELLKDWDYERNLPSRPSDYAPVSNFKVWWKCHICGYAWQSKISNRVHGRGCPACNGRVLHVGHNDLATTHPELAAEWHPTKNGILKPTGVSYGQSRKVWWLCPKGHAYLASLNKRTSDHTACPVCNTGRQTSFREQAFYYYIKQVHSDAISRYNPDWLARMELDIYIPSLRTAIEYDGAVWHKEAKFERERRKYALCREHGIRLWRVKESMPEDGWGLADQMFSVPDVEAAKGFRSLLHLVLDALDPESNFWTRKNPRSIHSLVDVDLERDRYKIVSFSGDVKNSLAEKCPDIAAEWHPTRNGDWHPTGLYWRSDRKVWWRCATCGKEFEMTIAHRTTGSGCPDCAKKRFAETYRIRRVAKVGSLTDPDLVAEWNLEKNEGRLPSEYSPRSSQSVWWKCRTCGYEWMAKISNRAHGRGCPYCANRAVVVGKNDLLKGLQQIHAGQDAMSAGHVDAVCGGRNMVKFIKAKAEVNDELY